MHHPLQLPRVLLMLRIPASAPLCKSSCKGMPRTEGAYAALKGSAIPPPLEALVHRTRLCFECNGSDARPHVRRTLPLLLKGSHDGLRLDKFCSGCK